MAKKKQRSEKQRIAALGNSGEKQGLAWRRKSYDMAGMDKHRDCNEGNCMGTAKPSTEKLRESIATS